MDWKILEVLKKIEANTRPRYYVADQETETLIADIANQRFRVKTKCNSIAFFPDPTAGNDAVLDRDHELLGGGPPVAFNHDPGVIIEQDYQVVIATAGTKIKVIRSFYYEISEAEYKKINKST